MILNHYYKIIKFSFLLSFSLLFGKSFSPIELEFKENLIFNDNEREYFLLYKDELNYEIEGPIRLEIISRRAIPERSNRKYEFGYALFIDGSYPININHKKYKKNNMMSNEHPGHGYTQAGKAIINLPQGIHKLSISPLYMGKPTLIRVIKKLYKKTEGITELIIPNSNNLMKKLVVNDKKRRYFRLEKEKSISFRGEPENIVSLYGRTNNDLSNIGYNFYQIEILENNKQKNIIVDYFFKGSNKKKIYQVEFKKEKSELSVRLINSNVPVFLRILKSTPYE